MFISQVHLHPRACIGSFFVICLLISLLKRKKRDFVCFVLSSFLN